MAKAFLPALRRTSAVLVLIAGTASTLAEDAKGHVPKKAGQCVRTEISELGSRLEGSPDSGSAISYANGVTGVSYEVITAIRRSRWAIQSPFALFPSRATARRATTEARFIPRSMAGPGGDGLSQIVSIVAAARRSARVHLGAGKLI